MEEWRRATVWAVSQDGRVIGSDANWKTPNEEQRPNEKRVAAISRRNAMAMGSPVNGPTIHCGSQCDINKSPDRRGRPVAPPVAPLVLRPLRRDTDTRNGADCTYLTLPPQDAAAAAAA